MKSNLLVFCDNHDIYKSITFNEMDYVQNYIFSHGKHEQAELEEDDPLYVFGSHNRRSPQFLMSVDCHPDEDATGIVLFENRAAAPYSPNKTIHVETNAYHRIVKSEEFMGCLEENGNFFFLLSGDPQKLSFEDNLGDSILKHFKLSYFKDNKFYEYGSNQELLDNPILILFNMFKMGELPINVNIVNTDYVGFHTVWSDFTFSNSDTICSRVMDTTFPLKQEVFDTVIKSANYDKMGKYLIVSNEKSFDFEIFGLNTTERFIKRFKDKNISNFNDHLDIQTNLDYSFTGLGCVSVNLTSLNESELGYIKVAIRSGKFFNEVLPPSLQMGFEYVFCKKT